jgi:hypothetical protein
MAVDTGGSIHGAHIDFFEGRQLNDNILAALDSSPAQLFNILRFDDGPALWALQNGHFRGSVEH